MIFPTSLALIALPALVAAQYGAPPPPAGGSSSTSAATSVPSAPPNTAGEVNVRSSLALVLLVLMSSLQ
jgi:hypothetical protein